LKDLEDVLTAERERSPERVELAGTKIPISEVARWGILLILVVQIYLLVHLSAVRVDTTDDRQALRSVAWMGIYDGGPARAATIVTAMLLPVAVLCRLVWSFFSQGTLAAKLPVWVTRNVPDRIQPFITGIGQSLGWATVWLAAIVLSVVLAVRTRRALEYVWMLVHSEPASIVTPADARSDGTQVRLTTEETARAHTKSGRPEIQP
jgi:hypothetical protein